MKKKIALLAILFSLLLSLAWISQLTVYADFDEVPYEVIDVDT